MLIGGIKADILNLKKEIVKLSLEQLGKPYLHDSYGPYTFDCAGFISYIYGEVFDIDIFNEGYGLSTTTKTMTSKYGKVYLYNEDYNIDYKLQFIDPGDILLFHTQSLDEHKPKEDNRYPGHCGIYLGDGYFVHCSSKRKCVVVSNFQGKRYKKILVASKALRKEDF